MMSVRAALLPIEPSPGVMVAVNHSEAVYYFPSLLNLSAPLSVVIAPVREPMPVPVQPSPGVGLQCTLWR